MASGRKKSEMQELTKLGNKQTVYESEYNPKLLERFNNKHPKNDQWVTFVCPEFTSLCPITGQPDFATIYINYIAEDWMVESKSLKLYLFSFRNHGDFHEDCVQKMCNDLANLLSPRYLEVIGEFTPRGGIAIYPYSSYSNGKKTFQEILNNRKLNYAPGKYTRSLNLHRH